MKFVRTSWGVWILLFFMFLPFPYSVAPNFGERLSTLLFPVVELFGSILGVEMTQSNFHSDSVHLYLQLFTTLILSGLISSILLKIKSLNYDQLRLFLTTSASYILAFFLIKYGCDKLFKYQFYDAAPNTLFTPVGQLSKDILFWSSMGSSHSYNMFMGLIEIIPGILLLWNRTRMLGAMIGLGVLTNVLAINFGFDITVKLLSIMLVVTALFILESHFKRFWFLFVKNQFMAPDLQETIIYNPLIKRSIKGIIVGLILIESLFTYASADEWNGDNLTKINHYGSYLITQRRGNSAVFDLKHIKRIHVHNSGYLITEDHNGNFTDYKASISPTTNQIKLIESDLTFKVIKHKDALLFVSNSPKNDFRVVTNKIDLSKLPYHSDSFHWTVESFTTE